MMKMLQNSKWEKKKKSNGKVAAIRKKGKKLTQKPQEKSRRAKKLPVG
jgi:hypothetical protein